ncbi:holin, partial [Escherichia coli]
MGRWWPFFIYRRKSMSEPLSGSGTAVALGGATVFGLFTGTDFGIVFG